MSDLLITNIGTIVSGDLGNPLPAGDAILVKGGKIVALGASGELRDRADGALLVDAMGSTVMPGLMDPHFNVNVGDWTPRQRMLDVVESTLQGGVTTLLSQGEWHIPGRPKDPLGVKSICYAMKKIYENYRPAGVKIHAGAVVLSPYLSEADFAEMAANGISVVAEVGIGGVDARDAIPMVRWARKYGMKVSMHVGGVSIPGSSNTTPELVMEVAPDIIAHINGGPTAIPLEGVRRLIEETDFTVEIAYIGNTVVLIKAVEWLAERNQLHRLMIATDSPAGYGVIPCGIIKTVVNATSLGGIAPEAAVAAASGNTARVFSLDYGTIAPGRAADLMIVDAPLGSAADDALGAMRIGDLPGISMGIIDGQIVFQRSRNIPPAKREAIVRQQ